MRKQHSFRVNLAACSLERNPSYLLFRGRWAFTDKLWAGRMQNEKNSVFCQAGMKAYNSWCQGETDTGNLSAFWNKVVELDQAIKEKQQKKAEMEARYDEEINLIQSNINISMAAASGGKVCPSCKAVVKEGDLFCEKCGTRVG